MLPSADPDPVTASRVLDLIAIDDAQNALAPDLLSRARGFLDILQRSARANEGSASGYVIPVVEAKAVQHDEFYSKDHDRYAFSYQRDFLRSWAGLAKSKDKLAKVKLDALFRPYVMHRASGYAPRDQEVLVAFAHESQSPEGFARASGRLRRRRQLAGEPCASVGCVTGWREGPLEEVVSFDMDAYIAAVRAIKSGDRIVVSGKEEVALVELDAPGIVRCKSDPSLFFDVHAPWKSSAFLYPATWPKDNMYDRARAMTKTPRFMVTWRHPPVTDPRDALEVTMTTVAPTALDYLSTAPAGVLSELTSVADLERWLRRMHGGHDIIVPQQTAASIVIENVDRRAKCRPLVVQPAASGQPGTESQNTRESVPGALLSHLQQIYQGQPRKPEKDQTPSAEPPTGDTVPGLRSYLMKIDAENLSAYQQSQETHEARREKLGDLLLLASQASMPVPPTKMRSPALGEEDILRTPQREDRERTFEGMDDVLAYRPLQSGHALDWIGSVAAAGGTRGTKPTLSVTQELQDVLGIVLDADAVGALAATLELYNSEAVMRADLEKELAKIAHTQYLVENDPSWQRLSQSQRDSIEAKVKRRAADKEREMTTEHRNKSLLLGAAYVAVASARAGETLDVTAVSSKLRLQSAGKSDVAQGVRDYVNMLLKNSESDAVYGRGSDIWSRDRPAAATSVPPVARKRRRPPGESLP